MTTSIKKCNCIHKFQDERYGFGMRVHNRTKEDGWRCTVCSDVKKKGAGAHLSGLTGGKSGPRKD